MLMMHDRRLAKVWSSLSCSAQGKEAWSGEDPPCASPCMGPCADPLAGRQRPHPVPVRAWPPGQQQMCSSCLLQAEEVSDRTIQMKCLCPSNLARITIIKCQQFALSQGIWFSHSSYQGVSSQVDVLPVSFLASFLWSLSKVQSGAAGQVWQQERNWSAELLACPAISSHSERIRAARAACRSPSRRPAGAHAGGTP